ncbi:hypothetical protein [Streptomyces marianii]|uniref:hypothetical protein n=1 Tax=Streptomyces marianii TaxID=1817406 RepID=UPI002692553F|nr:hypothetical protein [Streptomyces marianii]
MRRAQGSVAGRHPAPPPCPGGGSKPAAPRRPGLPAHARGLATEKRILQGRPWPEDPVPLLPVAQLYARDVPLPFSPPGADLLQVLWCPFDHPSHPRTAVFWRSASTVTDVLDAPPEPPALKSQGYLPEPSLLAPERVTEYPAFMELDEELRQELGDPSRWGGSCPATPRESYESELSTSPGWKTGGWSRWGLSDPMPRRCPECGTEALPLLTIATLGWDADSDSWAPEEERTNPTPLLPRHSARELHPDRDRPRLQPPAPRLPVLPGSPPYRAGPVSKPGAQVHRDATSALPIPRKTELCRRAAPLARRRPPGRTEKDRTSGT